MGPVDARVQSVPAWLTVYSGKAVITTVAVRVLKETVAHFWESGNMAWTQVGLKSRQAISLSPPGALRGSEVLALPEVKAAVVREP